MRTLSYRGIGRKKIILDRIGVLCYIVYMVKVKERINTNKEGREMRYQLNHNQAKKVMRKIGGTLKDWDIVSIEIPDEPKLEASTNQVKVFLFRDNREILRSSITMAEAFSL
jgi:hypothetical protein